MENIIEQLSSNPLYLGIGVVLAIILVYGIIKKVVKLIIILAIALIAFVGYLQFTGRDVPSSTDELKQSVSKQVDKAKESANQAVEDALQSAKDELAEKLKKKTGQ